MSLEGHIDTFESVMGKRIVNRPRIKRFTKTKTKRILGRKTKKIMNSFNQSFGGKSSFFSRLYQKLGLGMPSLPKGYLVENFAAFFDDERNIVYAPLKNESLYFLWHELGHALLYDLDNSFSPSGYDLSVLKEEYFIKMAFGEGFANFCANEVLKGTGQKERFIPTSEQTSRIYNFKTLAERNIGVVKDFQKLLLWMENNPDPNISVKEAQKLIGEKDIDIEHLEKAQLEVFSNSGEILRLAPVVGYYYVESLIEVARRNEVRTPILVDLVLEQKPSTFDQLFRISDTEKEESEEEREKRKKITSRKKITRNEIGRAHV